MGTTVILSDGAVEHIGDLCDLALPDFHAATATRAVDADREQTPKAASQEYP